MKRRVKRNLPNPNVTAISSSVALRMLRKLLLRDCTVHELARLIRRDRRTVTRYLNAIRRAGFRLRATIEAHGRKRWRAELR